MEGPQALGGPEVPELDRTFATARHQAPAVGAECEAPYVVLMPVQCPDLLARREAVDGRGVAGTRGSEPMAIGTEGEPKDLLRLTDRERQLFPGPDVENVHLSHPTVGLPVHRESDPSPA